MGLLQWLRGLGKGSPSSWPKDGEGSTEGHDLDEEKLQQWSRGKSLPDGGSVPRGAGG